MMTLNLPEFETLLLEYDQQICVITINRPDKLNALNARVMKDLHQAFKFLNEQDDVRGIIVTGSGDKAFVAGADINELSSLTPETGRNLAESGQRVFAGIENSKKPVIAVVNGFALGGGTELALSCHVRIATENAVFGLPEVSLGIIPGYGGTQRLTRLIGKGRAMELILTGKKVKAGEAAETGLVNAVYGSKDDALQQARDLLGSMMKNGPVALQKAIEAINSAEHGKDAGYLAEAGLFAQLCGTNDFKEGTSAFLEKRKPSFSGN